MPRSRVWMSAVLVLIAFAWAADAGQMSTLQLSDGPSGSPVVTLNYSNADGTGNNSSAAYADPMVSNGTNPPLYYCIDLWHDNYLGSSYTFTPAATIPFAT